MLDYSTPHESVRAVTGYTLSLRRIMKVTKDEKCIDGLLKCVGLSNFKPTLLPKPNIHTNRSLQVFGSLMA
jgi:hypothetical protein